MDQYQIILQLIIIFFLLIWLFSFNKILQCYEQKCQFELYKQTLLNQIQLELQSKIQTNQYKQNENQLISFKLQKDNALSSSQQLHEILQESEEIEKMQIQQMSYIEKKNYYYELKKQFVDLVEQKIQQDKQIQQYHNLSDQMLLKIKNEQVNIQSKLLYWKYFKQQIRNFLVWIAIFSNCVNNSFKNSNIQVFQQQQSLEIYIQFLLFSLAISFNAAITYIACQIIDFPFHFKYIFILSIIFSPLHFIFNLLIYQKLIVNSFENTIFLLKQIKAFKEKNYRNELNWTEMNQESVQNLQNLMIIVSFCNSLIGGLSLYLLFFKNEKQSTSSKFIFYIFIVFESLDLFLMKIIFSVIFFLYKLILIYWKYKPTSLYLAQIEKIIQKNVSLIKKMEELFETKKKVEKIQEMLFTIKKKDSFVSNIKMSKKDQFVDFLKQKLKQQASKFEQKQGIIIDSAQIQERFLRIKFPNLNFQLQPKIYNLKILKKWQKAVKRLIYSRSLITKLQEQDIQNKRKLFDVFGKHQNIQTSHLKENREIGSPTSIKKSQQIYEQRIDKVENKGNISKYGLKNQSSEKINEISMNFSQNNNRKYDNQQRRLIKSITLKNQKL